MYKALNYTTDEAKDFSSNEYWEDLATGPDKLMKYFNTTKLSPIYNAAALNSRTRMMWLEDHWAGYDHGAWVRLALRMFQKIYNKYTLA